MTCLLGKEPPHRQWKVPPTILPCTGPGDDELNLFKELYCLIIFCSDIHAYSSWMLTLNKIEEVFVLFVSAALSFPCQYFINIRSVLLRAWGVMKMAAGPAVGTATGSRSVSGSVLLQVLKTSSYKGLPLSLSTPWPHSGLSEMQMSSCLSVSSKPSALSTAYIEKSIILNMMCWTLWGST